MTRARLIVVSATATLFLIAPFSSPAAASHNCGLEDASTEVDTVCDNYHNPKPLLSYIVCHFITGTC